MPVQYNTVERGNPARPKSGKKFYPSIESTGRVTLRELTEEISETCTLTSADMLAAIEILLLKIPRELAKGNIVELGDFGNFWLRSTSKGANTAEQVSGEQITNLMARFNAGKEFKRVLRSVDFEKKPRRRKSRNALAKT